MKHQVEVRNITKKISQLNTKLDTVNQLAEPRENSYIEFQRSDLHFQEVVQRMLADVGQIKTSKTFPSLCRVTMETSISNLETTARLQTIDYHGKIQVVWSIFVPFFIQEVQGIFRYFVSSIFQWRKLKKHLKRNYYH